MRISSSSVIDALLSHQKFGSGVCFRRLYKLLDLLLYSEWGRRFSTIRITGSNGKGSVTALTHSILRALGVKCGRYTSPHLEHFRERIVIDGDEITDAQIESAYYWLDSVRSAAVSELAQDTFGSFELITALCLLAFFEADIPVGVMEAGIGGRYDPVRLLPGKLVALTSIDLEHTELLGKTRELIAYDKLDLCPEGGTVVALRKDEDLWDRMSAYCRLRQIKLVNALDHWVVEPGPSKRQHLLDHMDVCIKSHEYSWTGSVPLVGTFQLDNIAIACTLADIWASETLLHMPRQALESALVTGLQATRWPGRFEQISTDPPVIIDVGHSPDACSRFVQSIKTFLPDQKILLVTGVSTNKAVEEILQVLAPIADRIICTRAYHHGENVQRIQEHVRMISPTIDVREALTIEEAVELARTIASSENMTVVVAGGLFLAIEFRTAWKGQDPRMLRFL